MSGGEPEQASSGPEPFFQDAQHPTCPQCQTRLEESQLVVKEVWTVEGCPRCGGVVRTRKSWHWRSADSVAQEDIAAVDLWLAEVAEAQGLEVELDRPLEGGGAFLWRLSGLSTPWACEAEYNTASPRTVEVRLRSDREGALVHSNEARLQTICAQHGVHPWGVLHIGDEAQTWWWGVGQLLNTVVLSPDLFPVLLDRLQETMRDVANQFQIPLPSPEPEAPPEPSAQAETPAQPETAAQPEVPGQPQGPPA